MTEEAAPTQTPEEATRQAALARLDAYEQRQRDVKAARLLIAEEAGVDPAMLTDDEALDFAGMTAREEAADTPEANAEAIAKRMAEIGVTEL
jgi:hypothetical protein